jgi:hypothetical protein
MLPALLFGCAQQPLVYQQPAPVYRPQPAPLTRIEPKPEPKLETYKLPAEPIISEEIEPSEAAESVPEPGDAAASAESNAATAATNESADSAGYSAPAVAVTGSPAVLALMDDAERNSKSGDLEAAAATIERALRIDSRNPALLYKLAQVRLKQNQPRLAEDLAKKSELYAGNNRELKRNSWLLIAKARYMPGDKQGAGEARNKANQF